MHADSGGSDDFLARVRMTRSVMFIPPHEVPAVSSAVLFGVPVMAGWRASPPTIRAAELVGNQWTGKDCPRLRPPLCDGADRERVARCRHNALNSFGAILDFYSFSDEADIRPENRHACAVLYLDPVRFGRGGQGDCAPEPTMCVRPATTRQIQSSTTRGSGLLEAVGDCDYLFTTKPGRAFRSSLTHRSSHNGLVRLFDLIPRGSVETLTGPDIDADEWSMPYSAPGEDITADTLHGDGIVGTYLLHRRDEP